MVQYQENGTTESAKQPPPQALPSSHVSSFSTAVSNVHYVMLPDRNTVTAVGE